MVRKILLFFLFFTLVYRPEFIFIPHSVNMFFGMLGLFFYIGKQYRQRGKEKASEIVNIGISIKKLYSVVLPFVLISFFSIIINGGFDLYYPRYALSLFLGFFSFYLLAILFKQIYGKITVEKVTDYFVMAECVFLLIGLISFFSPEFYSLMTSIQKYNEISEDIMEKAEGLRLISIGAQFFSAAIINCFVLMLIGFRLLYINDSIKFKVLYLFAFAFVSIVGMMMARTTIFGIIGGLFLFLLSLMRNRNQRSRNILSIVVFFLIGELIYLNISDTILTNDLEDLSSFGFEMFINYQNGDGFTAHSNNSLYEMYNTVPNSIKTWLIGDARWSDGNHYYMRVDSGYLRGLWYFGILGLICLFWYYYRIIYYVVYETRVFYGKAFIPTMILLMLVLVLNYKGPVDLYFLLLPFNFCDNLNILSK